MIEWDDKIKSRASWSLRLTFTLLLTLSLFSCVMTIAGIAYAHGGSTDANGCHKDHKSGVRHCHGSGSAPAQQRTSGSSVYYPNCAAARAAGAAPIYRGQPGYGPHLDRDGDGKACE